MLSSKQLQTVREARGRVNIWEGAIRSGKTIGSILRWLLHLNIHRNDSGDFVMVGRTRDAVWRNVLGPMQDPALFGDVAAAVVGNYGAPTATILGRRVFVMGANDVKAENVIRGLTVLGAYVDEVTVVPENFFVQLLGRMSPPGAKLFGTTNPDSPAHWLKTKYFDRMGQGLDGWRTWHFTLDDNPTLDPAYVRAIKQEFTGLWYKRFVQGLWVQAEGAIYQTWDADVHVVDEVPPLLRLPGLGVDYGTTNATRGELIGVSADPERPGLYVTAEWAPSRMSDPGYSRSLRTWLSKQAGTPEWIYLDPAAASLSLQLNLDGLLNVTTATNDVLPGIRTVDALLSTRLLHVSRSCVELIKEFPGYVWDPKATLRGLDVPLKTNDHALDALRYAVHSTRSLWTPILRTVTTNTPSEGD